jgi:hypothetical protein
MGVGAELVGAAYFFDLVVAEIRPDAVTEVIDCQ